MEDIIQILCWLIFIGWASAGAFAFAWYKNIKAIEELYKYAQELEEALWERDKK